MLRFLTLALACLLLCPARPCARAGRQAAGRHLEARLLAGPICGRRARELFGPNPKGRLIVAPDGYWSVIVAKANRKPATNNAERAALLRSMVAYRALHGRGRQDHPARSTSPGTRSSPAATDAIYQDGGREAGDPDARAGERAQSGQAGQQHADLGTGALSGRRRAQILARRLSPWAPWPAPCPTAATSVTLPTRCGPRAARH